MSMTYEERVREQIAQYAETINMHDLPDAFHIWSNEYIRPALEEVFDTGSIDEAYALAYFDAGSPDDAVFLSIGSGDGAVEIRVAKILLQRGIRNFKFVCTELSPILIERHREALKHENMENFFEIMQVDLNNNNVDRNFDVIMANHSLHHIIELESLFDFCKEKLLNNGVFIACDMIGRNGHQRWSEAKVIVDLLWPLLNDRQKYHVQLQRFNPTFIDHDCTQGGVDFEGIRAQDIMPLLLQRFHPFKFVGCGGIIDLFVDRGFGHGFNVKESQDLALVHMIAKLNDVLLDADIITPVWTMASFTKADRGCRIFRARTPEKAVRRHDPFWLKSYVG